MNQAEKSSLYEAYAYCSYLQATLDRLVLTSCTKPQQLTSLKATTL